MFFPSGDQRGKLLTIAPIWVSCRASEPSLSHIQISLVPELSDENATRWPSGENCGLTAPRVPRVELIQGLGLPVLPDLDVEGGKSKAQILVVIASRVYTSR